ncbi:hypothetical protein EVAR_70395_1 [Eumeta japonica]|uniref:Uncharacterized protein n=1 Tax=Eumeta variegata TaxID=151549 RepID=A0A4C1SP63_EUMVA|nr:hypothetical protein EVAR_70395_1 [Eumeta japonica]
MEPWSASNLIPSGTAIYFLESIKRVIYKIPEKTFTLPRPLRRRGLWRLSVVGSDISVGDISRGSLYRHDLAASAEPTPAPPAMSVKVSFVLILANCENIDDLFEYKL